MKVFLNIMFLTHQGGLAGSTYSIYYLAKGLAEKEHRVYVGCPEDRLLYRILAGTAVTRIAMPFHSKIDFKNMCQIRDLVERYQIDIINAQSGKDRYTSILSKLRYGFEAPIIHTRRQIPKSSGLRLQNWFYTRFTKKLVAVSQGVKDALINLGLPAEHIEVIHNGTPAEKYLLSETQKIPEIKQRLKLSDQKPVIGCVSRKKQQEQLLRALHHIKQPLTVIFAGVENRPEYQTIIQTLNSGHDIRFMGSIQAEDILYYYKLFDIKVLPSVTEGLSQALLEAMALGVPVIATRAAGNSDLIRDGHNGYLFDNGDTKELAAKINQLLTDKKIRQKFIINGRYTAIEQFSIENTVNNYEQFFIRMVHK